MSTPLSEARIEGRPLVDYARSLDCIHCGLCLPTCPTYRLTGSEASSPRGRIWLMRGVAEGRLEPGAGYAEELDFCLVCRHCESVCPAGVQFGAMMEVARDRVPSRRRLRTRLALALALRAVLPRRRALRLAAGSLRLAQRLGLARLAGAVLGPRGAALATLPAVPKRAARRPLPALSPAEAPRRGAVAMLEGCVQAELFADVNRDTARLLRATGHDVHCPPGHACCGALHAHNGDLEGARTLARRTLAAFDGWPDLPIVVNSAGCGAHMQDYGRLLAGDHPADDPDGSERARAFASRVVDLTVLLAGPEPRARLAAALAAGRAPAGKLTWDDPCHLCHGQGVRLAPRELLDLLPGVERVELEGADSCCGSAGLYSLLRPTDSARVLEEKLAALRASGARTLVTSNPGCQLQWSAGVRRAGLSVDVLHIAEVLARALQPSPSGWSEARACSTGATEPGAPSGQRA